MNIWVDADACPVQIRDVILRAARRLSVPTTFVANKLLVLPEHNLFRFALVTSEPDAADQYIVEHALEGDLVVTQDIPLAALIVPRGVTVISPRGDSYNQDNIADRLAGRDLRQELRDIGEITSSQRPFDDKLKRQFASLFDAALHRLLKTRNK